MSLPKPKGQDHIFKAVPVDSQTVLTFQGWRGRSKSQAVKGRAALGLVQVGPRQNAHGPFREHSQTNGQSLPHSNVDLHVARKI